MFLFLIIEYPHNILLKILFSLLRAITGKKKDFLPLLYLNLVPVSKRERNKQIS